MKVGLVSFGNSHVQDGHWIFSKDCICGPTQVLLQDPGPVGLPEILTILLMKEILHHLIYKYIYIYI